MKYYIKATEIYSEDGVLNNGGLIIKDGIIEQICQEDKEKQEILDLTGYKVLPGLIDMHIHGANSYDTMDASYEALNEISKYLAQNGITAFLPTTMTVKWESSLKAVENIDKAMKKGVDGAEIIGAYVEGPYITKEHKGAQPEAFIRDLDINDLEELISASNNSIKILTIAPEKEKTIEAIKFLTARGIEVSLGHTNATFEQTKKAIENGARIGVHTFNGMRGLHHREPGVVGALLAIDDVYTELIADTIHVNPAVMKILAKCKGVDKVCLISDCMRAGGLDDGEYILGELEVVVKDSIPRLKTGSLAGSTLKLINAVKNMIQKVNIDPIDAVHMASLVPAKILKMDDMIGSIKQNKKANLTVIDDNYNVVMTIIEGKIVYNNI
ncbi:N-acetylglucosamine-6-phosphate deacetylase [Abyssisolibacter fermentans]|uniref:N-acetylglucosamine-6-phosphate deacetylase n=1 Tax=Abyssisolibacter fermentans TaxID=1766203 RepID=UPI0008324407|nr:N-acetylglucosamine-6-phosphate deacetylase [Abyssisolibacter fermentans]